MVSPPFENYVNYAGSKTGWKNITKPNGFENYVNYAGSKTPLRSCSDSFVFENYVNYAGSKTFVSVMYYRQRLRTM